MDICWRTGNLGNLDLTSPLVSILPVLILTLGQKRLSFMPFFAENLPVVQTITRYITLIEQVSAYQKYLIRSATWWAVPSICEYHIYH